METVLRGATGDESEELFGAGGLVDGDRAHCQGAGSRIDLVLQSAPEILVIVGTLVVYFPVHIVLAGSSLCGDRLRVGFHHLEVDQLTTGPQGVPKLVEGR